MSKATTEHADYLFAVKEHRDGSPFIMLEPRSGDLKVLGDGFLTLELAEGTSTQQARELADRLNGAVERVSYTRFVS